MAVYSHYMAMTTDPGAVPPDAAPLPHPDEMAALLESGQGVDRRMAVAMAMRQITAVVLEEQRPLLQLRSWVERRPLRRHRPSWRERP